MFVGEFPEDISSDNDSFLKSDWLPVLNDLLNYLNGEGDAFGGADLEYYLSNCFDSCLN